MLSTQGIKAQDDVKLYDSLYTLAIQVPNDFKAISTYHESVRQALEREKLCHDSICMSQEHIAIKVYARREAVLLNYMALHIDRLMEITDYLEKKYNTSDWDEIFIRIMQKH